MERKLATARTIKEIIPIEGADRIELARIDGWQSVIKKGDFKVGDLIIFAEIDSILPFAEWSEFLRDKKNPVSLYALKQLKVFDVYDIDEGRYYSYDKLVKFCADFNLT